MSGSIPNPELSVGASARDLDFVCNHLIGRLSVGLISGGTSKTVACFECYDRAL